MAYGTFKSVGEIAKKFNLKVIYGTSLTDQQTLLVPKVLFSMVENNLKDKANYISEYAICDALIRPILGIVAMQSPLSIWSHVPYNIDEKKGLIGEPDYLIAPVTQYGEMAKPALCVIEAKKADFDEGWAQALAEMVASSLLGTNKCYGIVSTGEIWQFGKLENNVFMSDSKSISATRELQYVFNTLNWLFNEILE